MKSGRGNFLVHVNSIGGGVNLHFKREDKSNQPALGVVVLKSYLSRYYPQVKFTIEESRKGNYDALKFKTYYESLFALHEICTSGNFAEDQPDSDTTLENAYAIMAAVVRKERLQGKHLELDAAIKEVIFTHSQREFQQLKNDIFEAFKDAHFRVIDPNLQDYIERINKMEDRDLVFQISKNDILLALIAEHLKVISKEGLPEKIHVYERILREKRLDSFEKIKEHVTEYEKYAKKIFFAMNKVERIIQEEGVLNRFSPTVRNLYHKLQILRNYGEELKIQLIGKGQIICNLADNLKAEADEFFKRKDITELELAKFKANFAKELKGESKELAEPRFRLTKIIANILIALSGIGLIALAAKAAYSYKTEGRVHLFFSKPRTTSERHFIAVREASALLVV